MSAARPVRSVRVPPAVREAVFADARRAGREEACGLLVGRRIGEDVRIDRAAACDNVAPKEDRNRRFEIDPRRVIEEERREREDGGGVVGFYHSHPASDPVPSEVDRRFMELWPASIWLIAGPASLGGSLVLRAWSPGREPGESPIEIEVAGGGPTVASGGAQID